MNNRITLITILDNTSLLLIETMLAEFSGSLCKVPYGKVENREIVDTLPYHFTISAYDVSEKDIVYEIVHELCLEPFILEIDNIEVMKGSEGSFVLYLSVKNELLLKKIQETVYKRVPNEYYNPEKFNFHMTLHIDKDFERIMSIKKCLESNFNSFEIRIERLALFSIYPAKQIC